MCRRSGGRAQKWPWTKTNAEAMVRLTEGPYLLCLVSLRRGNPAADGADSGKGLELRRLLGLESGRCAAWGLGSSGDLGPWILSFVWNSTWIYTWGRERGSGMEEKKGLGYKAYMAVTGLLQRVQDSNACPDV